MPREHVTTDPEPPARSVWRRRLRRRRRLAWASLVVLAIPIALIGLSRVLSIGYRDGYRMIELRDGMVGYYSNPGYKRFVWLDRGREEGWLLSGPAKVPPAPYRLYSASRSLVQIYVKLWHVSALLAAISATLWWRARGQEKAGRCFACGYDLRGIPRGGTAGHGLVSCPECGAVDDDGLNTTPHHPDQPAGSSLAARGVIFAGGGTGGHIFPGIAIAERLEASGAPPRVRACFAVSTREIDARILGHAGRSFTVIPAEPFSLRPLALWRFVSSWGKSVRAGRKVIREARALCPGGVELVATGGFVAAPMVQAARAEGVGVTLVNLDTVPGRANRWIGRHAARIFSAAPLHGDPLGGSSRIEFVPPIVRSAALAPADAAQCRRMLGLDPGRPTLLVTGASQGARSINAFMAEYAGSRREVLMRDSWQLIHQTGRGEAGDVRALYESLGIPAV
nr:UDP-N-acetylglucosamine--N-acetylmuramyl-(pentapeptide) pyrophosphoryl-undecaprenol N-acetylglucosamine transferase [Phycisphaerales bacterium]